MTERTEREREWEADEGFIFKADVKKAIRAIPIEPSEDEGDAPEYIRRDKVLEAVDRLPVIEVTQQPATKNNHPPPRGGQI